MPRLTDADKQDVLRHLDADKPLPDKYRFLLFDDKREVELVWNGKTNEVCNLVLPFQTIEHVDEPRAEAPLTSCAAPSLFDTRGRQQKGWTNKLIWGDNKLILSSLNNGPLRDEIEKQGGLKLIYIDPPFDVGADFSMDIEVGDGGDTFTKRPNILEEIAYRDTWGRGADSFIAMIYERLILMRDLLAEDGSIYVHCDPRVNQHIRMCCDEVFGRDGFVNEIIWQRLSAHNDAIKYGPIHDVVYFYRKGVNHRWNPQHEPLSEAYVEEFFDQIEEGTGRRYSRADLTANGTRNGETGMVWRGIDPNKLGNHWKLRPSELDRLDAEGRIHWPKKEGGMPRRKKYVDEAQGRAVQDLWTDIKLMHNLSGERTSYPTQKPEPLLSRIISASSNPGDLVADFFVGSGTTAAVAEKLGRKWIATDLGKFAIHTTRKRMIGVQRALKAEGKDYRAFEILNLGKYERQAFIGVSGAAHEVSGSVSPLTSCAAPDTRESERRGVLAAKEAAFVDLILKAYKATPAEGLRVFHGKKAGRMVVIGPVNLPVTRLFVEEIILECRQKRVTRVDLLGFEFEMGLFPHVLDEAKAKGIDVAPKYIPAEVFDKRAVEKDQVVFHDVAAIEVKPIVKGNTVAVRLTDFSVYYSQDSAKLAAESLKEKGSKIVVDRGQIVKISKDKAGIVSKERLTKHWTDWVDYWSVDFDFESKREIIRVPKEPRTTVSGEDEWEERWTGDYVFENEWQSFRTKKDRGLELTSAAKETDKKRVKIAVKVVDIFGNDTMTIIDVGVKEPRTK